MIDSSDIILNLSVDARPFRPLGGAVVQVNNNRFFVIKVEDVPSLILWVVAAFSGRFRGLCGGKAFIGDEASPPD
jgi:hypothetical protein